MLIIVRPRHSFQEDAYVEWSVKGRNKWYPLSHIYIGTKEELPLPEQTFKTESSSKIWEILEDYWNNGLSVLIDGSYDRTTKRLTVTKIIEGFDA